MSEKIQNGWKWVKLGEVAEIKMGQSPESKYYNDKGIGLPFLQGNKTFGYKYPEIDIFCSNPIKIAKKGEVLISVRAPVGDINIANQDICIGRGLASINSLFNQNEFLFYCLKYSKNDLLASETGTVFGSINKDTLNNFSIPLPPLPEQKAIAEVLSSIDDKIDLLHRQNKTLEEMAMTLFRQWFIEPTKDGLPEGWGEKKLKDIYFLEKGIEPGSKNYLETPSIDSIRFIRVGDMLDNKANVYIQKDLVGNSICKFDDLLVSFDGTVGRVSFGIQGCYSSGIRKIYSKDEIYNKLWLKHQIFVSEDIQDEINMYAEGTTILHASSSIDYLSFAFPLKEKIEEYDKFFDPIYKKMLHNKKSIQTLEKLRDTLLPKLMSGEVRAKMDIM
ncbi:MAG TPA: restriction endonuclease subunit S [Ignavibacteriales bacterium]|nr:restriction endonuclease subunit S [Ignavibacteriales bacterium]